MGYPHRRHREPGPVKRSLPPRRQDVRLFLFILPIFLLLGIFLFYPLARTVWSSFTPEGRFSVHLYRDILAHPYYLTAIGNSVLLGILVATAATTMGFLFAFTALRVKFRGGKFLRSMAMLPMLSPRSCWPSPSSSSSAGTV